MTSERSNAEEYIQHADRGHATGSHGECAICGATDALSMYSLRHEETGANSIRLCPTHYRVARMLDGSRQQDRDHSSEYDLQETRKITVRVPRALIESADSTAERHGQTRSELVRDGIQLAIEAEELTDAFEDILSRAVRESAETEPQPERSEPTAKSAGDTEFLKERIRTLESLLEDSIEKL